MKKATIFFDHDNTLYSPACRLWDAISQRINTFIQYRLNVPIQEIESIRKYCRENFEIILKGLQKIFPAKNEEYLDYVHDLDLSLYISEDMQLKNILNSLPHNKIIFTNSDRNHASRVLKTLGIEDCFKKIIDIYDISPFNKPQKESLLKALQLSCELIPSHCGIVDDRDSNLTVSTDMGFKGIQPWCDDVSEYKWIRIPSIHELPLALEKLNWL